MNRHFSQEDIPNANKNEKIFNITNLGEMQIKTTSHPLGWLESQKWKISVGKDVKKLKPSYAVGGDVKCGSHCGR